MQNFRDALKQRVILFDGAMGTEIYKRGVYINRSYDEVNLTAPDLVEGIHRAYVDAGADVITTNTFGANRLRLMPFGLEDQHDAINAEGVRLAKAAAENKAWVAGSIGPTGAQLTPIGRISPGEAFKTFKAQATILADEGVDLFVLETFSSVQELWAAVRAVTSVSDKPVVASLTFQPVPASEREAQAEVVLKAVRTMREWAVDAIGTNCSNGPRGILDIVEIMASQTNLPILAMPNAGLPQVVEGRTLYLAGPEYMAEYARRHAQAGARIVGGCCGTSPETTKEMRNFLQSIAPMETNKTPRTTPVRPAIVEVPSVVGEVPVPAEERSTFAKRLLGGKFCISVELDPPKGTEAERAVNGAAMLHEAGIDVVNIADGPRAVARMGPSALSHLVKQRSPDLETVVHYCCRDRNLLGMQMDLMGAHAVGLRNILAVTGDPPKMGTYPDATAVFDIDSVGLINFIQGMNRGVDFSGKTIGGKPHCSWERAAIRAQSTSTLKCCGFAKRSMRGRSTFSPSPSSTCPCSRPSSTGPPSGRMCPSWWASCRWSPHETPTFCTTKCLACRSPNRCDAPFTGQTQGRSSEKLASELRTIRLPHFGTIPGSTAPISTLHSVLTAPS